MERWLRLDRLLEIGDATLGRLIVTDEMGLEIFQCPTIERRWKNNARGVSCIPTGVYLVRLGYYHRGGYPAFELQDVPGRSHIKIHAANYASELEGCIGVGRTHVLMGQVWRRPAVTYSKKTLAAFHDVMAGHTRSSITVTKA